MQTAVVVPISTASVVIGTKVKESTLMEELQFYEETDGIPVESMFNKYNHDQEEEEEIVIPQERHHSTSPIICTETESPLVMTTPYEFSSSVITSESETHLESAQATGDMITPHVQPSEFSASVFTSESENHLESDQATGDVSTSHVQPSEFSASVFTDSKPIDTPIEYEEEDIDEEEYIPDFNEESIEILDDDIEELEEEDGPELVISTGENEDVDTKEEVGEYVPELDEERIEEKDKEVDDTKEDMEEYISELNEETVQEEEVFDDTKEELEEYLPDFDERIEEFVDNSKEEMDEYTPELDKEPIEEDVLDTKEGVDEFIPELDEEPTEEVLDDAKEDLEEYIPEIEEESTEEALDETKGEIGEYDPDLDMTIEEERVEEGSDILTPDITMEEDAEPEQTIHNSSVNGLCKGEKKPSTYPPTCLLQYANDFYPLFGRLSYVTEHQDVLFPNDNKELFEGPLTFFISQVIQVFDISSVAVSFPTLGVCFEPGSLFKDEVSLKRVWELHKQNDDQPLKISLSVRQSEEDVRDLFMEMEGESLKRGAQEPDRLDTKRVRYD